MKTVLLTTLLALSTLFAQAREVRSINDLKIGDTITLKITVSDGVVGHSSIWDFDQVQKIDVQLNVISTDKDSIRFGVKPTNWYARFQDQEMYEGSMYKRFKYYGYFDSYFFGIYGDGKKAFYLFKDNNVIFEMNKNNGKGNTRFLSSLEEKSYGTERQKWYQTFVPMPSGIKVSYIDISVSDLSLDFGRILNMSVEGFVQEWIKRSKEGQPIPWCVDLKNGIGTKEQQPTFVQVISASFDLPTNVQLTFTPSTDMPEDRIFISNGFERIKPIKKQTDSSYIFKFFLPSPKRMAIKDLMLDITPDDSINIEYNATNNSYTFSGEGGANCAYINEIVKFYRESLILRKSNPMSEPPNPLWYHLETQEQVNDFFARGKEQHSTALNKYIKEMNPYWIRSAKLSYSYWYASEKVYINNIKTFENRGSHVPISAQYEMDWNSEEFGDLFPISDYLYQPYSYSYFIDNYFDYKAIQTNDDVLTGMKYLRGHLPKYYLAEAIFWGYPKYLLTSETLKYLMTSFHLSESNREYLRFLESSDEPELRNEIINLHHQLEKVEPGANIKDLNLEIASYIPFNTKKDNYIALLVDDELENVNLQIKNPCKEPDKISDDLVGKITQVVITSESRKAFFDDKPEMQKHIIFVPDKMLRDYYDKIVSRKGYYIVMRSDGTIIDRFVGNYYNDYGTFLLKAVEEDIEKQQNQSTASSSTLITIIISSIFSIVFTFFVVRYFVRRRESIKRHISELELKAIRAQMNPHFTFNALGSIQNLINQKKDKEANDYLVNFAKLLRMVLSTSEKKLITLSEEIEQLDLYLRLEQLRVPFQYHIEVDKKIDTENEEIPGMLIQPIVENAVKHAIVPKGGGKIDLRFGRSKDMLNVTISDSGDGYFETSNTEKARGFGLQAVRERLNLLSKELKINIGLRIENIETENNISGCMVTISIPV